MIEKAFIKSQPYLIFALAFYLFSHETNGYHDFFPVVRLTLRPVR